LRREPAFDQIGVVLRFSWQHNSNLASFHIVTMYCIKNPAKDWKSWLFR
jgi:hypothetical protein